MGEVLMRKMSADTDGIAAYAASAATMSGDMAAIAANAAGSDPLLLAPVFGLIGGDFLAAYAATHAGHVAAIGQLSAVLGSIGGAATTAATVLTEGDHSRAEGFQSASKELGA
ncbi:MULTISPECIES: hypothetical protein [unclassified Nocardia]|uniref:hypothetical protein n=1 Tax=unclassified Nocardia TaxID=2637762 RepID=UPI001CE45DF3|nr:MULTISPECIES: hypothetical protein [unclassified Nocardia]